MDQKRIVLKNIGALFGAQVISSLLTPFLLIFIARKLGDETFGKYSFILALTQIFLIVSDFGVKAVATRDVARDTSKTSQYLGNIIVLKLAFSFLTILTLIISVHILNMPRDTTIASYIFACGLFFQSMSYAFRWVFQALQIMEYEALQRVVERALLLVLSLLVLWRGLGLYALSVAFLITQIIVLILSLICAARSVKIPRLQIDFTFFTYILKTAVFFALCEVLWMVYFKIDQVMLAKIKGETEVGWYNAAYVIVNFISLIVMLTMQVMFPVFSSLYEKNRMKLRETTERIFRYLILIASLIVPVVFVLADWIIRLLYGNEYVRSIDALRVLIFVIVCLFPVSLFSHILAASNRHKTQALVNLSGVIINITLNALLIPKYSYIGAAVATIATQLLLSMTLYTVVYRFLRIKIVNILLRLLPAVGAMVLILVFSTAFSLIAALCLSTLVYLSVAYLTKSIRKEDFSLLFELVKKEAPESSRIIQ